MIRILNIKIANYRSFKNEENTLKNLNVLNVIVGKNNVGKTNVLRALYLFFNPSTYNPIGDRNMIKQITGGATKEPKIQITFEDDEITRGQTHKYSISCDLNKVDNYYKLDTNIEDIKNKFSNSSKIEKYLENKFKCVYLSTTDEDITSQSQKLVDDMILQYFKKQSTKVKNTIEEFEAQYKTLIETFKDNIHDIERDLSGQFEILNEIDLDIKPKLEIVTKKKITEFLLENIELQLDDSYAQDLSNKGAGIQRASLILLSLFLLNEIFSRQNKIVLLDEPEAFLYPLLVRKIKTILEERAKFDNNFQIFITSHSRDFLKEINNESYRFINIEQKREEVTYARSKNDFDINKYSTINQFNSKTKYQVLKNYGLLDEIDDYENIIICEGPTDKNYLLKILKDEDFFPQIRYGKHSEGLGNDGGVGLKYNYIGKGATSVLPILVFLDNISEIQRKVFVLLDGDEEGKKVDKQIRPTEYNHLDIKIFVIEDNKEIEDMVFTKEDFIDGVLEVSEEIRGKESNYRETMNCVEPEESYVEQTKKFIDINRLNDSKLPYIKHQLSINLNDKILNDEWILNDLRNFFNESD